MKGFSLWTNIFISLFLSITCYLYFAYVTFTYQPKNFQIQSQIGEWVDFSLQQRCKPKRFYQPKTQQEIIEIIQEAKKNNENIKVVGAAHSMSSIAMTSGTIVNLDYYNKVLDVNIPQKTIKVQAGIRLYQLNFILNAVGLAMQNLGQITEQSIAGATQTCTHGTGIQYGCLSTFILEMDIILANGSVITASRTENPEIFQAARVGLGALGIVSTVTLQCTDAFKLHKQEGPIELNLLYRRIPRLIKQHEFFKFWWIPHTNMAKYLICL